MKFLLLNGALLAATLPAQCNNLVPNGDFESFFPPWQIVSGAGNATFPDTDVTGLGSSRSLRVTAGRQGFVSVELLQSFSLDASTRYVLTADVLSNGFGSGTSIAIDIVDQAGGGAPIQIGGIGGGASGKARLSAIVEPGKIPASGAYRMRVTYRRGLTSASVATIDNIRMRSDATPTFSLTSTGRRENANVSWSIVAKPFQVVAVSLSVVGVGGGAPVPTCGQNPLYLLPNSNPLLILDPVFLNSTGRSTGSFAVPAGVAGVPFRWQAIGVPVGMDCVISCPETIAF